MNAKHRPLAPNGTVAPAAPKTAIGTTGAVGAMGARGAIGAIGAIRTISSFRVNLASAAIAALLLAHCGGGSGPTAPEPLAGKGELFFVDSGCACVNPPFTPIPIYVDGQQAGLLPVFGKLSLSLAPGPHTWSDASANDPNPNHVVIQPGQVLTENLFTNVSCSDDQCSSDSDPMALRTPSSTPAVGRSRSPR
jgi:hypothetical protein